MAYQGLWNPSLLTSPMSLANPNSSYDVWTSRYPNLTLLVLSSLRGTFSPTFPFVCFITETIHIQYYLKGNFHTEVLLDPQMRSGSCWETVLPGPLVFPSVLLNGSRMHSTDHPFIQGISQDYLCS